MDTNVAGIKWEPHIAAMIAEMDEEIASLDRQIEIIQQARELLETDGEMTCAEDWAEKLRIGSYDMVERCGWLTRAREMFGNPTLPAATFSAEQAAAQPVQPKPSKPKADPTAMTLEERADKVVAAAERSARPSLRSKISATTIRKVRKDAEAGKSIKELCAIHDLKPSTTSNIINRKGWFATVE